MIYPIDSPYIPHLIDEYKTGYDDFDILECTECGSRIKSGKKYYNVCGRIYCAACRSEAEKDILSNVADDYIFECQL